MDEIVNRQKLNELVQKQEELGLPLSVLKHGELGSYRNLIQKNDQACENEISVQYSQLISKIKYEKRMTR